MQTDTIKISSIGNSLGFIVPKEVLAQQGLSKGDALFLSSNPDGMTLSKYDPAFAQQMAAARLVMKKRRNVLRELAK
jgi:putative addiction module antidote